MRFVVQRVREASVTIDGEVHGRIDRGFLVLAGVSEDDDAAVADKLVKKLLGLRIFEDEQGKTNLSLADVGGSLLIISQFTLYADCKKGNRPSFVKAARPEVAEPLYEYIVSKCREGGYEVATGVFGADMKVALLNDGPFTVILDSAQM
ncbi:MAG: D-tyrosyl-tRNA(Tyr) deacylase [Lachnospiraceae bacterium]|nr:D-tyrosyl-tRNA(Tyr) deacylase [Lachnospiraceae bacterium]